MHGLVPPIFRHPHSPGSISGAVLYFDNSSAVARSITNQVRGRKSDESLTSAISAAEKQKLAVSYIFVSTTQISARSWGCRGRRGVGAAAAQRHVSRSGVDLAASLGAASS